MSNFANKSPADKQKYIIDTSCNYAENVLKNLISLMYDEEVENIFESSGVEPWEVGINLENKEEKIEYKMKLEIVDNSYKLDLGDLKGNEQIINQMIFLLRCIQVIFPPIKFKVNEWAKKNNKKELDFPTIGIDGYSNVFLDAEFDKKIGIKLYKVS